jgi:hypothetical protein
MNNNYSIPFYEKRAAKSAQATRLESFSEQGMETSDWDGTSYTESLTG